MNLSDLEISYENESGATISQKFLVPLLKECKLYRRLTYSFTSAALKSWAGALASVIDKETEIEVLCDLTDVLSHDNQLKRALEIQLDPNEKSRIIEKHRDTIILDALAFNVDQKNISSRHKILDYLIAKGQLKVKFAYPKVFEDYLKQENSHGPNPLYHKKLGYFMFSDDSKVAFMGSWNETANAAFYNGESCNVYSNDQDSDTFAPKYLKNTVDQVDRDWSGGNDRFSVTPLSEDIMAKIKNRAPSTREDVIQILTNLGLHEKDDTDEITEDILRRYQLAVINDWDKNDRKGLIEHATGSGKTWSAIFAMKRHLKDHQNCIVIVPSTLLLKQWVDEINLLIKDAKILRVGDGHRAWKQAGYLASFSSPDNTKKPKIIIAIRNSAASDFFLNNIKVGEHQMLVSDEVHGLGSKKFSKIFNLDVAARLGVSATPKRYGDQAGTNKIFSYFRNELDPKFNLNDAITDGALVPYEYYPRKCYLNDEEQEKWDKLTTKIRREYASITDKNGKFIASNKTLTILQSERARIAKEASSKLNQAAGILRRYYKPREQWLVYCQSIDHIKEMVEKLKEIDLDSSIYHSKMNEDEKIKTLNEFRDNGGILLSIRCLDEGVDIPSISHALIMSSDQNPRQFIQRRGRVLRIDKNNPNKDMAYIYDLIISCGNSNYDSIKSLTASELKRSYEFASNAKNDTLATANIMDIAVESDIDLDNFVDDGNNDFEEDDDDDL